MKLITGDSFNHISLSKLENNYNGLFLYLIKGIENPD